MRKQGRARWVNIYELPDGTRRRSHTQASRANAVRQGFLAVNFNKRKLLYRLRVRYFTEPAQ